MVVHADGDLQVIIAHKNTTTIHEDVSEFWGDGMGQHEDPSKEKLKNKGVLGHACTVPIGDDMPMT